MIYVDTKNNLHSIMYLLIQSSKLSSVCSSKTFTFHNVSINSELAIVFQVTARHLHSIMYLLIQFSVSAGSAVASAFTFHNVSINSQNQ